MLKIIICSLVLLSLQAFGVEDDERDHGHKYARAKENKIEEVKEEKKEEGHKEEHGEEHGQHDDHENEPKTTDGFKLNPSGMKTFEIKLTPYKGEDMTIPHLAVYKGLSEMNLYRYRDGLFKRVDFKVVNKTKDDLKISSLDLKKGDEIVVSGVGFLRIAEIAATGGLSDSHSH